MTPANIGIILGQAVQTAYATTDMDRAISLFKDRYGIGQFLRSGRRTVPLETGGQLTVEIALAWAGDTMIEIIHPLADDVAVYTDWLPKQGFGLRLHHLGIRLYSQKEWDQMLADIKARDHRIVFHLTSSNTRGLYIDTSADLGHYVEYFYYMDPANSSLQHIPQNIPGHKTRY